MIDDTIHFAYIYIYICSILSLGLADEIYLQAIAACYSRRCDAGLGSSWIM